MLKIYNTMTKKKQEFVPLHPGEVGIYVCGMTVYDFCHVGNARVFVIFDVITRYLRELGYKVNYVRNITDIDDKIINRAQETEVKVEDLTKRFIACLHEDERALNIMPPTVEPLVSEHVPQVIAMVEDLLNKGFAYIGESGDVYFAIDKFKKYGNLTHQDINTLKPGIRVTVVDEKHNPLDFVLWKVSRENEPAWDSPWGKGRPGWHIECSVMSIEHLGIPFDIHGGGVDLQFPHHTNEIAQSEAACGKPFCNIWMHVGFVEINEQKMSKSTGNYFTIREVLQSYNPEVLRYFLLASHYRSPVDYCEKNLGEAKAALERFYVALRNNPTLPPEKDTSFEKDFFAAMDDDFNTPVALAVLFDLVREINRLRDNDSHTKAARLAGTLHRLGGLLGILQQDPEIFLHGPVAPGEISKIESLIAERAKAREEKDWAAADRVRDQLLQMGIEIEDTPKGTIWRHKL